MVIANGANMSESGYKLDPSSSSLNAFHDPMQQHCLTNSMVTKSARENRRNIIADKKSKRCTASESSSYVISSSPINESVATQIAREKRRHIIAAKKAMRFTTTTTTSNAVFSKDVQRSQQTKTKGGKSSRSSGEKLQHDISEAPRESSQAEKPPTNVKKK